jgi:hypothetical protein
MDKKIVGLVGAMSALASLSPAQAATQAAPDPSEVLRAGSYGELLAPIPNALALLQAIDAAQTEAADGKVELAQYYHHHHHHHHHRFYRPRVYIAPPRIYRRYHHHHHHHHHHGYYRPY